jgi:hypothetical protein
MDLNYLYHRHQVSLFRSENAACVPSRAAHLGLAEAYASRIATAKLRCRPRRPAEPSATARADIASVGVAA